MIYFISFGYINMLLSIIIPMFNSFEFLKKSLTLLDKEKQYDFEVIVVDDASSDDSFDKLVSYIKELNINVKLLRNESNLGPGGSRNRGILSSTGDYITFLDSDDYFSDSFFEKVIPLLDGRNECIIFDYNYVDNNGNIIRKCNSLDFSNLNSGYIEKSTAFVYTFGSTCCKIYKRNIAIDNDIKFAPLYINEDMPFTKAMIAHSQNIFYINEGLYNYVDNPNSIMHTLKSSTIENYEKSINELIKNCNNLNLDDEINAIMLREFIIPVANRMIKNKISFKEIKNFLNKYLTKKYTKNRFFKDYPFHFKLLTFCYKYKLLFCSKILLKIKELLR